MKYSFCFHLKEHTHLRGVRFKVLLNKGIYNIKVRDFNRMNLLEPRAINMTFSSHSTFMR